MCAFCKKRIFTTVDFSFYKKCLATTVHFSQIAPTVRPADVNILHSGKKKVAGKAFFKKNTEKP